MGHDWGGLVVWLMPLLHPARTAGVMGVNTPYFPRAPMPPIALFRAALGENHYIVRFQRPGVADAALARDVAGCSRKLVRRGVPLSEVEARLAARGRMPNLVELVEGPNRWGAAPERGRAGGLRRRLHPTGFTGGINWYRNMDRNWETTPQLDGAHITVPSLMVPAEWDPVLRPEMASAMPSLVDDLEMSPSRAAVTGRRRSIPRS